MKKLIAILGIFFLFLCGSNYQVSAGGGAAFSVEPVFPENQKGGANGYFDLKMNPGEKQTLTVKVYNDSTEEITVIAEANTATTNDNGITSYINRNGEKDSSLSVAFSEIVIIEEETITIPPNGEDEFLFTIEMPEEEFDGQILGGFRFTLAEDQSDESNENIKNTFAYTIGVLLAMTDEQLSPVLQLNEVVPSQRNYRNYIEANIQNIAATIIKDLRIMATIYEKDGEQPLYQASDDNMRMAPNSNFNFGISIGDTAFKAGTYRIEIQAYADGEEFNFTEEFEITSENAKEYNQQAVYVQKDYTKLIIIVAVGILTVTVCVFSIIIWRIKKRGDSK